MSPVGRPALTFADLAGARVGVWGYGIEGRASAARLVALGATLVLVDDEPAHEPADVVLRTRDGGLDALANCDVVVKTPGISRYRPDAVALAAAGIPIVGGLGLWMQSMDLSRVVAVTGTKGKSTTSAILGHLLRGSGFRTFVGGNIGDPPFGPDAPAAADIDFWVIETSSFQATDIAVSPHVVAVTSLDADHLDWHGDLDTYWADKLSLTTQAGAALTIANGDDENLRRCEHQLGPTVEWVDHHTAGWIGELGVIGRHNERNALIAQRCLVALGVDVDDGRLRQIARNFEGLPSRLHRIGRIRGVDFVDDSLATNVLPTREALEAFADRRVALIVGGHDRGIDYAPLADHLATRRSPTSVVSLPESGPRITEVVRARSAVATTDVDDLAAALDHAFEFAQPDGVVLLSPAAPSFGRYRNYADRSAHFAAEFRRLLTSAAGVTPRSRPG